MVDVKLFSGHVTNVLAEKISDFYGEKLGEVVVNRFSDGEMQTIIPESVRGSYVFFIQSTICLLYTSPSPRDRTRSRMPSSA